MVKYSLFNDEPIRCDTQHPDKNIAVCTIIPTKGTETQEDAWNPLNTYYRPTGSVINNNSKLEKNREKCIYAWFSTQPHLNLLNLQYTREGFFLIKILEVERPNFNMDFDQDLLRWAAIPLTLTTLSESSTRKAAGKWMI